jgi:hypothetical protein
LGRPAEVAGAWQLAVATTAQPVSLGLSGLPAGTTYHYHLVADGTEVGAAEAQLHDRALSVPAALRQRRRAVTTIGAMHAVLNRIRMREPLDDATLSAAQRDLDDQAAQIEGLAALQVLQTDESDLVVLVFGDDEAALERTRQQLGNAFMREHVIPYAAGPPERAVTKVILSYQRDFAA